MRDIRHCLGKYPFLGLNECPGPFFRIGHLLHLTMQRYSPIVPNYDTIIKLTDYFLHFPARNRLPETFVRLREKH